jgi:hypothetical protein
MERARGSPSDEGIDRYLRLMVATLFLWPNQHISSNPGREEIAECLGNEISDLQTSSSLDFDNRLRSPYERVGSA